MKICFVLPGMTKTGGVQYIFEICNKLKKRGYDVSIVSLGNYRKKWFDLNHEINIILPEKKYSILLPFKGYVSLTSILNKLFKISNLPYKIDLSRILANAIPPSDVVIATAYNTAYSVFLSESKKKFYCIQHDESTFSKDQLEINIAKNSYLLPLKQFAASRWIVKRINLIGGQNPIYLMNPVDAKTFCLKSKKENMSVMGFLRGIEWKGDDDMLKAFEIVNKNIKDVKFNIVDPKGLLQKKMKKLKIKLNKFEVLGKHNKEELSQFYSKSEIFVFASHLEGFGLPPLEAMACKCAVVMTDSGGINDYGKHEKNCLISKPKDYKSLANNIIKLLKDEEFKKKIGNEGLLTAKKLSKWDQVINTLEKEFKK